MAIQLKKKAQAQMWETIAIIMIFFFLLIGGITFYSRLQQASAKEEQKYYGQLNAIEITEVIQHLPELECPPTLQASNCIDEIKLDVMDTLLSSSDVALKKHYADLFGFSQIIVQRIVPTPKPWDIYNQKKTEAATTDSRSSANIPISIYDASQNTYGFGVLTVNVYK